ncbi:putative phage baseplate assembly protein [Catenulispora sp. GAS73]|uniref:putative baseplate assembly protein n=1 Tax=Catenulispora sp. GAS73 TaxID=3156269 RepID=UPI0035129A2A
MTAMFGTGTGTAAPDQQCLTDTRRAKVRRERRMGLDGVEVDDTGRVLSVLMLGKAPAELDASNIRIDGGRRVTGIRVLDVQIERADDPEVDDELVVEVDRPGDGSTYTLSIVQTDPYGRPGTVAYPGFDPRYNSADFSFRQSCPTDFDCAETDACPAPVHPQPAIDYTTRDYNSIRQQLLDRMSLTVPDWIERHAPDLGVTLVEVLAYVGDQLSYEQDAVATEAYLATARLRTSVRRHVRLIDYAMHDGCNSRTFVVVEAAAATELPPGTFRFAAIDTSRLQVQDRPDLPVVLTDDQLNALPPNVGIEVFEPLAPHHLTLHPARNTISFWTWGEEQCLLPTGTTSATLVDTWAGGKDGEENRPRALNLTPGHILLLEEVLGPQTGSPADADPTHRQAVRLTSVTPGIDPLYQQPVVEVTWDDQDALAFPLCLSAIGGPDCALLTDVSVARGNVMLVDHGRSITFCGGGPEQFAIPPDQAVASGCQPPVFGCADPESGNAPVQAIHDLLDAARKGVQLSPDQVRDLRVAVGPDEVLRAGLTIILAPDLSTEQVEPPDAASQAAVLETLLAQVTYPAIAVKFTPTLRYAPVTQAVAYPTSDTIAESQAALLAALPGRVQDSIQQLWLNARAGEGPTRDQINELIVLFGAEVIEKLHIQHHPARALQELLARSRHLLADKVSRLEILIHRADGGTVLGPDVEYEITHSWGGVYAEGLDVHDPRLFGPASIATVQNPRAALPEASATAATAGETPWLPKRDLLSSGPTDRDYVGETGDDGRLTLRFGDGVHGAPPPAGDTLLVAYRVGNGREGNVGAEAINHLIVCPPQPPDAAKTASARSKRNQPDPEAVLAVRNPLPAVGGTDPEPLDQVRQQAPLAPRDVRLRAVTAADYAELAAAVPGVERAAAEIRWTGAGQEAHVAIEPAVGETPSQRLLATVERTLRDYRRIGHDLSVGGADLVPLDIAISVCVATGYQKGHLLALIRRVLGTGTRPDGSPAFFSSAALAFGDPVRVSSLTAVVAGLPGVVSAQVTQLKRMFASDQGALATGVLPMGPLEIAQCDNDADRPENGRLRLTLTGGK